jgi:hypothetical protein
MVNLTVLILKFIPICYLINQAGFYLRIGLFLYLESTEVPRSQIQIMTKTRRAINERFPHPIRAVLAVCAARRAGIIDTAIVIATMISAVSSTSLHTNCTG